LPVYPDSGRWIPVGNSSESLYPGDSVGNFTVLKLECDKGHVLIGEMFLYATMTPGCKKWENVQVISELVEVDRTTRSYSFRDLPIY
jgi:hypothetical protein